LKDIFPEFDIKEITFSELEDKLKEAINEQGLYYNENQVKKIIQFYESFHQRIGVAIVGPSGSGKSTIWNLCKCAMEKLGQKIKIYPLNPKSISKK